MENRLSPILWLWIPLIAFAAQIILEISFSADFLSHLHSEWGPHETLQAIIIIMAFIVSLLVLKQLNWARQKFETVWFAVAALSCFYIGGEEISWGQHIFDWATPEYWNDKNDQGETNLHNTSSWLDQKPRLILLIGIIVGGLILPFLKSDWLSKLPQKLRALIPPKQFSVISFIVFVPYLVDKLAESVDISLFSRFSEVQELFMFYFVLLYVINSLQNQKKSDNP